MAGILPGLALAWHQIGRIEKVSHDAPSVTAK